MKTPPRRLPDPQYRLAALTYFVALTILSLLLMPLLFYAPVFGGQIKLGFFAMVVLVWWRTNSVLLLLAMQAALLFHEPTNNQVSSHVVLPALGLSLLAVADRIRAMRLLSKQTAIPHLPPTRGHDSRQLNGPVLGELDKNLIWPLARLAGIAMVCVTVAIIVLASVPLVENANQTVGLLPTELRMIVLCFVLMVSYLAASIVVGVWIWRKLSPAQASVYLRGYLASWLEVDWRRVIRRRQKLERTRQRGR